MTPGPGMVAQRGRRIAFTSERDGNREIYVMNANGSKQRRTDAQSAEGSLSPTWSPDGQSVAFVRESKRGAPSRSDLHHQR